MKNLTTRKIILGLLMTLVLGFGAQDIAKAVENPNTDDVATQTVVNSTVFNVGASSSISAITTTFDKIGTKETVSISRTSGITLTGDFYGLSGVTLTENEDTTDNTESNGDGFTYTRDGRPQTLAGQSTGAIGITFTTKGIQSVTISSRDYNGDAGGPAGSWSRKYTYYVKGPGTSTTTTTLLGLRNGYKTGIFAGTTHRERIHTGDGSHYAVTYTTIPEDAMAQIEDTTGALGSLEALHDNETSSAFDVLLQANATYQVTATVQDSERETTGVYIIGTPTLTVGHPGDPDGAGGTAVLGSKGTPGRINDTLPAEASPANRAFTAIVRDGAATPLAVPGVVVTFRASGSETAGGRLVFNGTNNAGTLVDASNRRMLDTNGNQETMATGRTLYVRTNASGQADVDFQLGTDRKQDVTISAVGKSKVVSAYAGDAVSGNQLVNPRSKSSSVSGHAGEYELRVEAEDEDGNALSGQFVEFRTNDGTLEDSGTGTTSTLGRLGVTTDTQGIAFVFFDPKDSSGSLRVTAHLLDLGGDNAYGGTGGNADTVIDDVIFNVRGGSTASQPPPAQQTNRLTISTTGEGTTRSVTVSALTTANAPISGLSVLLSGTATTAQTVTTGTPVEITLPSAPADYTLIATDPNGTFDSATITVTVSAPGTLTLTLGTRVGNQQPITVSAARGGSAQSGVNITITGGTTSTSRQTGTDGRASAIITLPTATSAHTLTVRAPGYDTVQVTAAAPGQQPGDTSQPTTRGTAGVADSIQISGQAFRTGTVNTQLDLPLSVRVLDDNNTGVANVRVTFRVRTGQGRLSQRGNGRATAVETDQSGYARAPYTPLAQGTSTVRANATGVTQTVTFTITANGASETGTDPGTGEPAETPSQESREIDPEVRIGAANRPPMLWVDGGGIYALVGADVQEFAPSVDNALNIAVAGNKVYWTEMTGESAGTINSANLDGTGVKELKSIKAVPMGIAVDTDASKLYWTNSRGRIQSLNADGSGRIENVVQNMPSRLVDLALSGDNVYWTQDGEVHEGEPIGGASLLGGESPAFWNSQSIPGTPGSLAIAGTKIYWTAKTADGGGTINSVNLDGSGAKQLASILAVPLGIAVDTARSKLYWTNSRGRVQSANLDGSGIRNVVNGLGMPGDMVLSNSIAAPATVTVTPATPLTPASNKYDINGDGTVDSTDVDALLIAVLAELTGAKYDVNGDGAVDVKDVSAVNKNLDAGAAGAPGLLGQKFSALEVDRLQAQIDLLIATNDRSPAAMRTLVYLQQLIVMARPEKTQLLANYPNPFNPETWIPYELATDTDVTLTIYNAQGVVVRVLQLGQQSAGYYTDRERAAYWDGRNALGEQVASGIYFYQLETDDMSSLRKMVILK